MSKYKTNYEAQAAMFKALGNPHRLALFHRLISCCSPGTSCTTEVAVRHSVGTLGEGMDIAPSTLSHHLKELNRAGLVQMQRQGKQILCWVEQETLDALADFFTAPNTPRRST